MFHLMDHPILEVVAECHDAHLVDHMKAASAIEVQDGVEWSGRCNQIFLVDCWLHKFYEPGMSVEEVLIINQAENYKVL